jgi:hypothetical protein
MVLEEEGGVEGGGVEGGGGELPAQGEESSPAQQY